MHLITEGNVSLNKIPIVINSVLKNLSGKLPERLPNKSLLSSSLMVEVKIVACKQACHAMLQDFDPKSCKGNVLHQDATTKYHEHYEGMQVTLKDGSNLSLGLCRVGGGDAATYTKSFNDIIDDVSLAYSDNDVETTRAKLITSIKCFLSDQCATHAVFNENIEKLRKDLLPKIVENLDNLSENEKNLISEMGKFACRLHLIANFGSASDKALKMFEDSVTNDRNPHSFDNDESGTVRLARTTAKALTKRGSDKSGIGSFWNVF